MKKKWLLVLISAVVLLLIVIFVKDYMFPYYKTVGRSKEINDAQSKMMEDVIGWLRVQGTTIDYPIIDVSTKSIDVDNYDYLWMRYDPKGIVNRMAIFGHNIQNVSSKPLINNPYHKRFEQLLGFVYKQFAEENQYIQLSIGNADYLYRIYSVYFYRGNDIGNNLAKDDVADYIKEAKKNSYYDYDVDVNNNDKLITLITCTRFFGPTTEYKFKVEARLIRKLEKIEKQAIKETNKYKEIKEILEEGGETNEGV